MEKNRRAGNFLWIKKYVVPFYAVCDGGWMSGGYPSSTDRSGHKFLVE